MIQFLTWLTNCKMTQFSTWLTNPKMTQFSTWLTNPRMTQFSTWLTNPRMTQFSTWLTNPKMTQFSTWLTINRNNSSCKLLIHNEIWRGNYDIGISSSQIKEKTISPYKMEEPAHVDTAFSVKSEYYVVGEVPIRVRSLEGGALEGVSLRLFGNLRGTHKYKNLPLCKQLSFYFLASFSFRRKEIFPWEHGNIQNWGSSLKFYAYVNQCFFLK